MEVMMNDTKKGYEEKLDAQLKEWSAQIELLKAKAGNAKADAKMEYRKTIGALQAKQHEAETTLQELKNSGDEAWEDLKAGAEKAWLEVKTAYHEASSRFK
jgi:chromosome segregation ATPase